MTTIALPASDWLRPVIYFFGGALAVVGVATLVLGGVSHWTAFIPLALGLGLCLVGFMARVAVYADATAGWIAAAIGVLALAGTLGAAPQLPYALAGSADVGNAGAVISRSATAFVSVAGLLALGAAAYARRRASR